jgi:hypothetical protein
LRELSELSTDNQTVESSTGHFYKININEKLLDMNIRLLLKLKLLNKDEPAGF